MTIAQDVVQGFREFSQKYVLTYRLSNALNQYILSDFKVLIQPDQAFVPLIVAVALGTILSFIPAPILDTLFVGIIFARFRQVNRSALLLARVVWNDLIVVPLYVPSFRFGMRLLEPYTVNEPSFAIKVVGFSLGLTMLTAAATIISTTVTLGLIKIFQKWQMKP
jgi:hypothetical protein